MGGLSGVGTCRDKVETKAADCHDELTNTAPVQSEAAEQRLPTGRGLQWLSPGTPAGLHLRWLELPRNSGAWARH